MGLFVYSRSLFCFTVKCSMSIVVLQSSHWGRERERQRDREADRQTERKRQTERERERELVDLLLLCSECDFAVIVS